MSPVVPESAVHSMFLYKTSCTEVTSIIAFHDEKFYTGDDEKYIVPVKFTKGVTVPYSTTLVNRSLDEGVLPDSLKKN